MQDRPTADELLAAVEGFLRDDVMPNIGGSRSFHARVAANALAIVRRELTHEEAHLAAEWDGLAELLGAARRPESRDAERTMLAARTAELCDRIRRGDADDSEFRRQVLQHLRMSIRNNLLVSNPRWIGE